ncbi:MAG TPA: PDZ domain-containing protein, partial [Terriglobales bacterium]|nr:PDZ domain-containing protein [Terriglobales bacterium]
FSPDGSLIAFTGEVEGNRDVYLVPAEGGIPRRLTFHPGPDEVLGWTPDGKSILFRSPRNSSIPFIDRLFTMPLSGHGFPNELRLPSGEQASLSPDGTQLTYVPHPQWEPGWKHYRGGQTTPIWIVDVATSHLVAEIPRENSNDSNPMWVGDTIYFLSDRNGPVSLFAYNTKSRQVSEVVANQGLDLKSASAGPGAIVYEQFGSLHLYDLNSHQARTVNVRVAGDLPHLQPHFVKVDPKEVHNIELSPTGVRAVLEAHGEILTVPSDKGNIRDLTNTTAVEERDPAWAPDGKWIAYFSDASGEYGLELRDQSGLGEGRKISLGNPPSFFYAPKWAPDSKKIAYTDKRLNLWYVDVNKGAPVKVDSNLFETPDRTLDPQWAPDSQWLTYTKLLPNHLHAVFVYSLASGKSLQITDGMSDARHPAFDVNGKYLYFLASTDVGLSADWLDMSSLGRSVTSSAYVVVLRKDLPSPLAPESDEEKVTGEHKKDQDKPLSAAEHKKKKAGDEAVADEDQDNGDKKEEPVAVRVDMENIGQRILALPIPARNYVDLEAGKSGQLFVLEAPPVQSEEDSENPKMVLHKFDLKKRKTDKFVDGIAEFRLSHDGKKLLYRKGEQWIIASTDAPPKPDGEEPKPGLGPLKMDAMQVYVDPRAEWDQMYREVWRIERDFLYDPHYHGLNLQAASDAYAPYLKNIGDRDELNYLFEEMLSNLSLGHVFVRGGDMDEPKPLARTGLLGADYTIANGRYRFSKVYNGENWNPDLKAPLTQPGVNVKAGEYLLAVNGRELRDGENLFSFFQGTAGKTTVLKVGPNADGTGAREVTVVPIESEYNLRRRAWIENNRRTVEQLSGGRVAYVYLPDTADGGYTYFNRYYFSQIDKQAAVIDERFNTGGDIADYIIDYLRRPIMSLMMTRDGREQSSPLGSIYGPKVMVINEMSGSGGDALPWYFRKAGIGPLIGKRTWGGLVGIYDYPELMDGGHVTAPRIAIYGLQGHWEVENHGIAPDFDVEMNPEAWRNGHDPQLEKAVQVVLQELKEHPPQHYERPPYPNYHQKFGVAAAK